MARQKNEKLAPELNLPSGSKAENNLSETL